MFWAATRHTTREEDQAYCLVGIFGVYLTPIYGEGPHAFVRLQEAILKQIPDQSVFVWGLKSEKLVLNPPSTTGDAPYPPPIAVHGFEGSYLFAASPRDFMSGSGITTIPLEQLAETLHLDTVSYPLYMTTSYGLRTNLPIVTGYDKSGEVFKLAFLACQDDKDHYMALVLRPLNPKSPGSIEMNIGALPPSSEAMVSRWDYPSATRGYGGMIQSLYSQYYRVATFSQRQIHEYVSFVLRKEFQALLNF